MSFDYDVMPTRGKENSSGELMRECNTCGERTYMLYLEDGKYKVVCENCEDEHGFLAESTDHAMELWKNTKLTATCSDCPLGWEISSYEGECYDCGCLVEEDSEWCTKSFKDRLKKLEEIEDANDNTIL